MANPDPSARYDVFVDPPPSGGGSSVAWSNPTRVTADDGSSSTATLPAGTATTHYLKATNFGLALPTTAVINGLTVEVKGQLSAAQNCVGRIYLYKNSVLTASAKLFGTGQSTANFSVGSPSTITFGNSTDLWSGTVLTAADLNASTFGVALKFTAGTEAGVASTASNTFSIDYMKLKVDYNGGITIGADVGGSVTLVIGRKYTYGFRNSLTGHISDIAPFSASTGAKSARNIPLSGISASTDTQVDRKVVLATSDGGDPSTLYLLADLDNGTTTLTDDVAEADLLVRAIYLETDLEGNEHGITDNTPPPIITLPTKHRGRLYGINGQNVYFSKNLDDVTTSTGTITSKYEEAWPAFYFFDISAGAETPRALLSDGEILYIGSERAIHRHFGSSPADFLDPEILFNDVGVLNQEVWQTVFVEGAPIGTMWLTPDNRVIGSDFNSYRDIGTHIQPTLNSINQTVAQTIARASFHSTGGYDLYLLPIPTGSNTSCDTVCVYDLRARKWVTWTLTDQVSSMIHIVNSTGVGNVVFGANGNQKLYNFSTSVFQDRANEQTPVNFTVTARTMWLNMGDPKLRKLLNELEAMTSDPFLQVKVEGASTPAEFSSPTVVMDSSYLSNSPFGDKKLYLANTITRDKFYRFTFTATSANSGFLSGYSAEVVPFHRL